LVRDKDFFFSALCDRLGLPSFGSTLFVYGPVVLLAVLCASCDYLGAMGDSSSTPPMSPMSFCSQLNQKGILHQLTCPQTPE
jgi:hypothetical protein